MALFKARDQVEHGHGGPAAGAAALTHAQLLPECPEPDLSTHRDVAAVTPPLAERLASLRQRLGQRIAALDIGDDLAEDIGSARWFRGLGTMLGLGALALSFWPDLSPVQAAPSMHIAADQRDEFRSQMILPLAFGADSGRHMAPGPMVESLASAPERPTVQMVATLGQGDSFGRMLQRAGVGAGDAARVSSMVAASVPLGDIAPGTRFDLTLGHRQASDQPRSLDRLDFRARFDLDLSITRQGGSLVLTPRPIAVDATPLRIRGAVGASLYRSARAAGAPAGAIQQYLQTLDAHLSLDSDIEPDDQFDIIVSYKRSAGGEVQVGDLLFAGLERGGKPLAQLLRWGSDGSFYEASGIGGQPRASMFMPVAGHLTSGYGMRRHPILGYSRMHAGVDFGAAWGSPIYAVSDGVVSFAGRHGGHGNYVRLEHGGGMGTGYGHMSR
ncbi:MAG: M23 family metallopeptidase, partial [Sphingomonadales bacterium]|nr:M23 family metallopeptidase [Sphingomonadales bacterium]